MIMENKELALRLAYCESESDVINVLMAADLWNNQKYWHPFGDIENNWSTIGNQQSEAEAALVEKIINSIDATLMKECLKRGIPLDSPQAPKSISDAMEQYFNIKGGKLQDITPSERTKFAKSIVLAATGDKTHPCITIVDQGEGQTPNKMPETILSINKSNKLKVPFVQGKFNMGGTGVLSFCGDRDQLQLIISKRCPDISNYTNDDVFSHWGFTVIRRERPQNDDDRLISMVTYLVSDDKKVRTFLSDNGIDVIPSSSGAYGTMHFGMYCRMYDFNLSPGLRSNINSNLYFRLSTLMPSLAYPIYLDECRDYKAHTMFRTLSGLNVRLNDSSSDSDSSTIEDRLSAFFNIDGQKLSVAIYVFKKTSEKRADKTKEYPNNEGVLLTLNGQTHGYIDRRFFRRKSVGYSYIADDLLAIVDCSYIDKGTREDLFMNSRDRMRAGSFRKKIESELEDFLKNDETLLRLESTRRAEAIADKLADDKPLEEILSSVFKSSSVLSKLFLSGERLKNPIDLSKKTSTKAFVGKFNPTYFTIEKKPSIDVVKRDVQIGRKFRITYSTDAVNDFFSRDEYPGEYVLYCDDVLCDNHRLRLHNGIAVLSVSLPEDAQDGRQYHYKCIVKDTNIDSEFPSEFEVSVIPFIESTGGGGTRKQPPGDESDDKSISPSGISLPNVTEVYKDKWDEHNFVRESALKVERVAADVEVFDFFINMDNIHLQTELKSFTKDDVKMTVYKSRYMYAMVLIGLGILGYYSNNYNTTNNDDEDFQEITPEEMVKTISEMLSPMILPMIDVLGSNI
jgi:hypothetical protein